LLSSEGYTVFQAEDGEAAIDLYADNKDSIHLLLLDLGLPKRTGVEVFKTIRAEKPDIKIIAMSGWGQRDTVNELYNEGIDHFIQKPYKPAEILETVRKLFST
jgi:two-component system, cell cycle sensor histidine kinase and response regulator CckA